MFLSRCATVSIEETIFYTRVITSGDIGTSHYGITTVYQVAFSITCIRRKLSPSTRTIGEYFRLLIVL